jgi:RimJ/RimL family protein N-acetyltransferase
MKIVYRKLLPSESAQYREIRLESLKAHPDSFGSSYQDQSRMPKLMFEKAIEQPYDSRFVIGAFEQKELIGICGFVPFTLDFFHDLEEAGTIIQMYVKPAYRGRKIGLDLVKAVIEEAFKLLGITKIVLGVKEDNMNAIRVYKKAGFLTLNATEITTADKMESLRKMIIYQYNWENLTNIHPL